MPCKQLLSLTVLVLIHIGAVRADTIHVHPGESIQAAIDSALNGDEIVVHPGTYAGLLDFHGKAITLRSLNGAGVTTIDGQQSGPVVTCRNGEDLDTVLEGFLITGGNGAINGGGMYIRNAGPTIRDCIFRGNLAEYGGGIFADSAYPVFSHCIFEENSAASSGGGLYLYKCAAEPRPTLTDCRFCENDAGSSGGGLRNWDSAPKLLRCVFYDNRALYSGGGAANGGTSSTTYTNCIFEANRADTLFGNWNSYGGGMCNYETAQTTLINCLFLANTAVAFAPRISHGGAVANSGQVQLTLINCTLHANHAAQGDACANMESAALVAANSIFWNDGQEIAFTGTVFPEISYSCVQNGWPGPGIISEYPQFDGSRLHPYSPCINAGDPKYGPPGMRDLDGHSRLLYGHVDMGAYEFGIGDYDWDLDVDAHDFVVGFRCMNGPDNGPYSAGCESLDFELDQDVDLQDFAAFQRLVGSDTF